MRASRVDTSVLSAVNRLRRVSIEKAEEPAAAVAADAEEVEAEPFMPLLADMELVLEADLANSGDEDGMAVEALPARGEVSALLNAELEAGLARGLDTGENESAEYD